MERTETRELLLRLSRATGVSGAEEGIARAIEAELDGIAGCRRTPLGCVIATVGAGRGPKVMTASHMDEVGFIVTHIEEDGFLRVAQVGGIDRKLYASACVTVHTAQGDLPGVIASVPPHLRREEKELPAADAVAVDLGLSGEEARAAVQPGDRLTPDVPPAVLLDGSVSAKALDDRACCAAVILAAKELAALSLPLELDFVFTTMEEVGSQGAVTAAGELAPDCCIALDVSFAVTPDAPAKNCGRLGGGPMLGIAPVLDNALTGLARRTAEGEGLPLQFEVMAGTTGTDADEIAVSGCGVRTVLFSIPQRYMHTPVEVIDPADVEAAAALIVAFCRALADRYEKEEEVC